MNKRALEPPRGNTQNENKKYTTRIRVTFQETNSQQSRQRNRLKKQRRHEETDNITTRLRHRQRDTFTRSKEERTTEVMITTKHIKENTDTIMGIKSNRFGGCSRSDIQNGQTKINKCRSWHRHYGDKVVVITRTD